MHSDDGCRTKESADGGGTWAAATRMTRSLSGHCIVKNQWLISSPGEAEPKG